GRGSGCVTQPKRFRMQSRVSPARYKFANQIGLIRVCKIGACGREAVERGERSMLPHFLHPARTGLYWMQSLGGWQNVILREQLLLTLRRRIDHLLDPVRAKHRVELRPIHLA